MLTKTLRLQFSEFPRQFMYSQRLERSQKVWNGCVATAKVTHGIPCPSSRKFCRDGSSGWTRKSYQPRLINASKQSAQHPLSATNRYHRPDRTLLIEGRQMVCTYVGTGTRGQSLQACRRTAGPSPAFHDKSASQKPLWSRSNSTLCKVSPGWLNESKWTIGGRGIRSIR